MTRDDCIRAAARSLAVGRDLLNSMSPRRAAEEAYYAGGPSVDEIERRIRQSRALAHAA